MTLHTPVSPHIHAHTSVTMIMLNVVYAMVPAIIVWTWYFGWGLLTHLVIATATALACEAIILAIRKKPVMPALLDGSALVTAFLIAFCIPPLAPWWTTVMGAAFAIIIAKQLYGGLGLNPFNPAMVGYVMLLISFPREMTAWIPAAEISRLDHDFSETLGIIFNLSMLPDAITTASPLDSFKTLAMQINNKPAAELLAGTEWAWINLAFLLGGSWLLFKKIISWHIPVTVLGSLLLFASLFYFLGDQQQLSPAMHLFSGATMVGAFFIATDPVTACTTLRGRLLYGAGIGTLTYIIRAWGGYPDAIAFAVLLMNITAPTIDYYTKPRVFGQKD